MGNTCTPMAASCQCMAKPIQYCKVKYIYIYINKHKKEACLFLNAAFIILHYNLISSLSLDSKLPKGIDSGLFFSTHTILSNTVPGTQQVLNKCLLEGLSFFL